jgi:hypothetical protein
MQHLITAAAEIPALKTSAEGAAQGGVDWREGGRQRFAGTHRENEKWRFERP